MFPSLHLSLQLLEFCFTLLNLVFEILISLSPPWEHCKEDNGTRNRAASPSPNRLWVKWRGSVNNWTQLQSLIGFMQIIEYA
jgi:hypothetical protein